MASPVDLDSLVVPVEGLDQEENVLGAGAFGVTYKVTVNGKVCAAKKLHDIMIYSYGFYAHGQREITLRKFQDECRTLSRLKHPNVVGFVGIHYGQDKNDMSLIMELLHTDLDQYLENHPHCHLSDKIHILHDVSKGLQYLHNCSPPIIHCDLTAFNVLLTKDLDAKIGDLGVSKNVEEQWLKLMRRGAAFGLFEHLDTQHGYYLPPEFETLNRPPVSTKLDIFSFGNLIIHTVIGEVPYRGWFHSSSRTDNFDYEQEGKLELMRRDYDVHRQMGASHCLYPLVVDCLHDEPGHRPSAEEVETFLKELCTRNPQQVLHELMHTLILICCMYVLQHP